jgi:hypothetical protein
LRNPADFLFLASLALFISLHQVDQAPIEEENHSIVQLQGPEQFIGRVEEAGVEDKEPEVAAKEDERINQLGERKIFLAAVLPVFLVVFGNLFFRGLDA